MSASCAKLTVHGILEAFLGLSNLNKVYHLFGTRTELLEYLRGDRLQLPAVSGEFFVIRCTIACSLPDLEYS
jgi:hypothetical protein